MLGQVDLHQMHKYLAAARKSRMAPWGFWHLNPSGRGKGGLKLAITLRHLATEETYTGNRLKRSSKSDGISPNPLGALEGKHIAMKTPKRCGNKYYNYNGFFSLVLLAHCQLRLQIPLSRCWGKWIFIRCTNI